MSPPRRPETRAHPPKPNRITLPIPADLDGRIWYVERPPIPALDRPHRHSELQLNLMLRGTATVLVRERRFDLSADTLIWLFPGQDHFFIEFSPDLLMWGVVFRPRLVRRLCTTPATSVLRKADPGEVFSQQLTPMVTRKLDALCRDLHTAPIDTASYNAGLGWLLTAAWEAHRAATRPIVAGTAVHPAVECAARLIRTSREPLGIGELARRCGLSPARLSRLFKQQTHVPLVRFRQQQMLERFFQLYQSGEDKTMLTAALAAGFGSYPQFHRVFKQQTGLSPAEYRRRVKW
jgi:AraC-like DNA-binding protein